ncbi:hypothetical protein [Bradyrhizobium cenepequi]|uniref:hypothetical protein n=1 Tax=Bradyrhizobium cenepequi TaxID=2821403 RepID=UPI001CE38588|nr:hypothetical protein [Bradyrhizobium cenepequi]MCA6106966.1 hypothetical protein [Bradyrhizobium cenepequi]
MLKEFINYLPEDRDLRKDLEMALGKFKDRQIGGAAMNPLLVMMLLKPRRAAATWPTIARRLHGSAGLRTWL